MLFAEPSTQALELCEATKMGAATAIADALLELLPQWQPPLLVAVAVAVVGAYCEIVWSVSFDVEFPADWRPEPHRPQIVPPSPMLVLLPRTTLNALCEAIRVGAATAMAEACPLKLTAVAFAVLVPSW